MQGASVNFVHAASGAGRVWVAPQLRADWMVDGYSEIPSAVTATLIVRDDYARSLTSSFGHNKAGRVWTNTGGSPSEFYVRDGFAYHQHTAVNSLHTSMIEFGDSDFDVMAIVTIPVMPTGAAISARVHGRVTDSSNYYEAVFQITPAGVAQLSLNRRVGGTGATLTGATLGTVGTGFAAGDRWAVRFRGIGSTFRGRAWAFDKQDEPTAWFHDNITDTNLTTGTRAGIQSRLESGNTNTLPVEIAWQEFRVISPGIDDLTPMAETWTVEHHLDDGLPDEVAFVSGIGVGQLNAALSAPPARLTGGDPMRAAEFFSPFNTDSPIYGFERDVAPVKLDHGLVTSAGKERVRVFTGRMENIRVQGGRAALDAISETRVKLMKAVQPPQVYGQYQSANATWAMSWALHDCEVYPSPPPQDGCRLWMPLHGSARSFLPSANPPHIDQFTFVDGATGPSRQKLVKWADGPYVAGFDGFDNGSSDNQIIGTENLLLGDGATFVSPTGKGKLEYWMKGSTNVPGYPAATFRFETSTGEFVQLIVTNVSNLISVDLYDGANLEILTHSTPLPDDGEWHFVGFAWNIATKTLWVNLDGVVETATASTIVPASFPTSEVWGTDLPSILITYPVSEVQLTTGVDPTTHDGWLNTLEGVTWTRSAYLMKSDLELASIAEQEPVEAWELLSGYALSELASMRCDENDIFQYRTLGHWVQDDQQVLADLISTETNTGTPDINTDPSKVRNAITVSFQEGRNEDQYAPVFDGKDVIVLPPGTTTVTVPLSPAAVEVNGFSFINVASGDTVEPSGDNFITVNSAANGAGTYANSSQVSAVIDEWDPGQAIITFTNVSGSTFYTANNKGWASINIASKRLITSSASVRDSDAASIAIRRSERSMSVTRPAIQSRIDARRLARNLLMALRKPVPVIENVTVLGDPRRQPGDLVTFADPSVTRVSGSWRTHTITHRWEGGARYTQNVTVRPTLPILIVGQGKVGQTLIGPEE